MATSFSCEDEDTWRLLEIIAHFMVAYFGHSKVSSVATVERFYVDHKTDVADDTYHHDGAYWVALRIHYVMDLGGEHERFPEWRHQNGYRETPSEAVAYFNDHYFEKP